MFELENMTRGLENGEGVGVSPSYTRDLETSLPCHIFMC
jgi:hypothetical protein